MIYERVSIIIPCYNNGAYVAEAILWAAVKTNPYQIGPAIEAVQNNETSAMAMFALSQSSFGLFENRTVRNIWLQSRDLAFSDQTSLVIFWRGINTIHYKNHGAETEFHKLPTLLHLILSTYF